MAKSNRNFKFELGDKVKHKVSGFSGIVTGRTEWLYGCVGVTVQPEKLNKDGKPHESQGFDEDSLELIKSVHKDTPKYTGGPVQTPPAVRR